MKNNNYQALKVNPQTQYKPIEGARSVSKGKGKKGTKRNRAQKALYEDSWRKDENR